MELQPTRFDFMTVVRRNAARSFILIALFALMTPAWADEVVRYMHTDALGSVVVITDQNQAVVQRMEYEPYGQQLASMPREGVGYTGHVQDRDTGLVHMQQRYYDPELGIFLSVDPITPSANFSSNFHRYRYANNNPVSFTDREGLCGSRISGHNSVGCLTNGSSFEINPGTFNERVAMAERYIGAVGDAVQREVRDTPADSAGLFRQVFWRKAAQLALEFGARIVPSEISIEGWQLREINISRVANSKTGVGEDVILRSVVGQHDVHTHPNMPSMGRWFHPFSSNDVSLINQYDLKSYVILPNGQMYFMSRNSHPELIR